MRGSLPPFGLVFLWLVPFPVASVSPPGGVGVPWCGKGEAPLRRGFPCELFFVWQSLFGDGRVPGAAAENTVREFVRRIAGNETVTLLYASKNAAENHALVLQEFLEHAVTEIAHA